MTCVGKKLRPCRKEREKKVWFIVDMSRMQPNKKANSPLVKTMECMMEASVLKKQK